jgi:hydroxymethylbilane synthase
VLDGRVDVAVHSAKDLPSVTAPGLVLAAIPERGDARDALVGGALDALPAGARVGTGSVRRRAQLAHRRDDLTFGELRGNIGTRLEKAAQFDAIVMAAVALDRLGLAAHIAERLDPAVMLPQVGQGAIAVECREDDTVTRDALVAIDDADAHAAVTAERAFLEQLGGGCNLPCAAYATVVDGVLEIDALLASLDGRVALRAHESGTDPEAVGISVAAQLLDDHGGRLLLDEVA